MCFSPTLLILCSRPLFPLRHLTLTGMLDLPFYKTRRGGMFWGEEGMRLCNLNNSSVLTTTIQTSKRTLKQTNNDGQQIKQKHGVLS